jgi:hypothetical protein
MRTAFLLLGLLVSCSSSSSSSDTTSLEASDPNAVPCPNAFEWRAGECVLREIFVAGGTFTMGRGRCPVATPMEEDWGTECPLRDLPRQVTVPPFYIDAAPSNVERFPCTKESCKIPVNMGSPFKVGYNRLTTTDFVEFDDPCKERGKRLIREDEWEFVVTAGGTRTYPWGEEPPSCDRLWVGHEAGCPQPEPLTVTEGLPPLSWYTPIRVLAHPPSPEGIYDLVHYTPHAVLPRPDLYNEDYSSIPYDFLVPADNGYMPQPDGCPTCPDKLCDYVPSCSLEDRCSQRCKTRRIGSRGGRQQYQDARAPSSSAKYQRSTEAYKGYVRGLISRETALARCVREVP